MKSLCNINYLKWNLAPYSLLYAAAGKCQQHPLYIIFPPFILPSTFCHGLYSRERTVKHEQKLPHLILYTTLLLHGDKIQYIPPTIFVLFRTPPTLTYDHRHIEPRFTRIECTRERGDYIKFFLLLLWIAQWNFTDPIHNHERACDYE